jgi:hypothetical protein
MRLYKYIQTTDIVGVVVHFGCWALLLASLPITWCAAIVIVELRMNTLIKKLEKRALTKLSEETYQHAVEAMEQVRGKS